LCREGNPATGPIYVKTTRPGDALVVKIQDIKVGRKGIMLAIPGLGILGDKVTVSTTKIVPIIDGRAVFSKDITLPLNLMIGVIGVAPAGSSVPCGIPGDHGGNMDTADIRQGVKLFLPVFVEGGLLAMGDVHAAVTDGETCGTGIEVTASVTVAIEVIKGFPLRRPAIETDVSCIMIASAANLEDAIKIAVEDMTKVVSKSLRIPFEEAYMLLSVAGNVYEVGETFSPKPTIKASRAVTDR
jgi:amidase